MTRRPLPPTSSAPARWAGSRRGSARPWTPSARTSPWPATGSTRHGGSPWRAAAADRPEVECEALEVLGRLATASESVALFRQAADLAERHGLTTWRLRALQELALTEATLDGGQVHELRRVAADAGAHVTVAQMDLVLADMALDAFERDTCREAAQRCVDASRRYGLASLPVALLWLAGAHALDGRGTEMEAVLAEAAAAAPGDPRVEADAWGRVRATYHALREDREALRQAARALDGVHARRPGDGVGVPGAVLVGGAARPVRRRPRPACPGRDRGVPAGPDRVRRRRARPGRRRRARPAGSRRRRERRRWTGPARRPVGATGRGTACASWPRRPSGTAGANRPPGCGRPRRSSPSAATTGSPGNAGPCWSLRAPRRSAAGAAGRPSPRPCAGSASPAVSSTCSSSSPTRCPPARSPPGCSSPPDGRAPRRQPVRPHGHPHARRAGPVRPHKPGGAHRLTG